MQNKTKGWTQLMMMVHFAEIRDSLICCEHRMSRNASGSLAQVDTAAAAAKFAIEMWHEQFSNIPQQALYTEQTA